MVKYACVSSWGQANAFTLTIAEGAGALQDSAAQKQLSSLPSSQIAWGAGLPKLFAAGATFGPLLDGIHGTVHLLNYDLLPLEVGGLHSSYWVPLLLGSFYMVAGSLQVLPGCACCPGLSDGMLLEQLQRQQSCRDHAVSNRRAGQASWLGGCKRKTLDQQGGCGIAGAAR